MKLLITGINGFVAHHYLEHLTSQAEDITVLGIGRSAECHLDHQFPELNFKYQSIDLLNKNEVASVITSFQPDHLLHLASVSSVGHSWHNPQESFVNNTNIFLNIVDQIRTENLKCRILSVGSSEEYGPTDSKNIPITETCGLHPSSPYAVARVAQEMISQIYCEGYGMDIVMTRSFNHFGPRQKDIFVIPSFAKQLVTISKTTNSTGSVRVGNLEIVRDFVDVRDVVKAYHLILKQGKKGEVYNVCSGKGTSLLDILKKMEELLQIKVNIEVDHKLIRPNDIPIVIGNNEKIKTDLNWKPEITLEQSIADTINWWRTQIDKH